MTIETLDVSRASQADELRAYWEYTPEQFEELIGWCDGCARIALDDEGNGVGMAFGFPWGSVGWIGGVLVLDDHRGQGLGQTIVEATLEALEDHGCSTTKLYATPKAMSLYERLDFVGESQYMVVHGGHRRGRDPDVVALVDHLDEALALDSHVFPGDRSRMVEAVAKRHPELALGVLGPDGELAGYAIARTDPSLTEIGPVVIRGANARVAQDLVDALLTRVPDDRPVEVTYPDASWPARSTWECRGFVTVDTPLEMRKGPAVEEQRSGIVATGGQELG